MVQGSLGGFDALRACERVQEDEVADAAHEAAPCTMEYGSALGTPGLLRVVERVHDATLRRAFEMRERDPATGIAR